MNIIYIAGPQRTGSTLIGRILAQAVGGCFVGESWYLYGRGIRENRLCGCGEPFSECRYWQGVLARSAEAGVDLRDRAEEYEHALSKMLRTRYMLTPWARARVRRRIAKDERLVAATACLFEGIAAAGPVDTIVDTSKNPAYMQLLAQLPNVKLHVLHLSRSPMDVAAAWRRRPLQRDVLSDTKALRGTYSRPKSHAMWLSWTVATRAIGPRIAHGRYAKLTYEDFIGEPEGQLSRVLSELCVEPSTRPAKVLQKLPWVHLPPSHSVSGNPNRLDKGAVKVKGHARRKLLRQLRGEPK